MITLTYHQLHRDMAMLLSGPRDASREQVLVEYFNWRAPRLHLQRPRQIPVYGFARAASQNAESIASWAWTP